MSSTSAQVWLFGTTARPGSQSKAFWKHFLKRCNIPQSVSITDWKLNACGTGTPPRLNSSCPTMAHYHTGTLHYHDCSFCFGKHLESKGYYLVSVPFSLFRELRSTGCFKVQVMHFQMEFFDLFDVPLNAVLDEFEKRNSRRNIPNFRMCRQYPWAALFRMCRQFSSECFHVAQL